MQTRCITSLLLSSCLSAGIPHFVNVNEVAAKLFLQIELSVFKPSPTAAQTRVQRKYRTASGFAILLEENQPSTD